MYMYIVVVKFTCCSKYRVYMYVYYMSCSSVSCLSGLYFSPPFIHVQCTSNNTHAASVLCTYMYVHEHVFHVHCLSLDLHVCTSITNTLQLFNKCSLDLAVLSWP